MKKRVKPSEAKQLLRAVSGTKSFWLCTNQEVRSLRGLSKVLSNLTLDVFRYHVNRDKNDFEVWIREVVQDRTLAREIARIKTKETLKRKITERVEQLSKASARLISKKRKKVSKTPKRSRRKKRSRRR